MSIDSFAVAPPPPLKTPLRVLHNVVQLTRGKTVDAEPLGIGDATIANQEFVLRKSPLTYLPAGDGYKSTLALFVDGVQWTEVASFYEQPPDAQVFVTFEDDEQKTHVTGGDGVNGAAFPTGAPIVARYRIESGLEPPAAGALTTIAKPFPGLRAVRYPVAGGGGADPDPRDRIRRYAPRSVLTFGRAISADDYEAIAAGAPSVTRVRAVYAWNASEQRATVSLFVGDTAAAVTSARNALLVAADPNRPVTVAQATAVHAALFIGIRIRPGTVADDVVAAVRSALADPDRGLFGERRTGIGESIYFSQMSDACAHVPGVDAVSGALLWLERPDPQTGSWLGLPPRVNVSAGEYLVVPPEWVLVFPEVLTSV
jgi:predicted phage baseplate assembly protein